MNQRQLSKAKLGAVTKRREQDVGQPKTTCIQNTPSLSLLTQFILTTKIPGAVYEEKLQNCKLKHWNQLKEAHFERKLGFWGQNTWIPVPALLLIVTSVSSSKQWDKQWSNQQGILSIQIDNELEDASKAVKHANLRDYYWSVWVFIILQIASYQLLNLRLHLARSKCSSDLSWQPGSSEVRWRRRQGARRKVSVLCVLGWQL